MKAERGITNMMFDKEYMFKGKHAQMVSELQAKLSDQIPRGFFGSNYEVYKIAPIIGYIYQRKSKPDVTSSETKKIDVNKIRNEQFDLSFNFRTLMILCNKDKAEDDIMNIAFRLDDKDDERKIYDELYNSYVLGGVEELYERILKRNDATSYQEYIMNFYDFVEDIAGRLYNKEIDD